MSYFKKTPLGATSQKRIVSQTFYRPNSNEYRFSTSNNRATPEPKVNKSFVTETPITTDFLQTNVRSTNPIKVDFHQESPLLNSSFTLQTLKK